MKFKIRESVKSSGLSNVMFGDNIVGSATPSKDKINPELLKDVSDAAKKAGVEVTITTAITGHKKGTRHETGNAVDIAIVNGKGFSGGVSDAKQKGIYDAIQKFVDTLVSMGYKKNSEKGNDKAVLTFGFPNHENHIHISRKSGASSEPKSTEDLTIPDESNLTISDIPDSLTKDDEEETQQMDRSSKQNSIINSLSDIFNMPEEQRKEKYRELISKVFSLKENNGLQKRSSKLNEEIERIRKMF